MKALKFTKPKLSEDGANVKRGLLMGKVEIKMYEGMFDGYDQRDCNFSSSFTAAAVDPSQSGLVMKKSLRSGEGDTVETSQIVSKQPKFKIGALVDVVTLNYCTALGLSEVGVLEKPDMWTHHRMKRPAKPDQRGPRVKPTTTPQQHPPTAQYPPPVQYPQAVQYAPTVQYLQQNLPQQNYHQPLQQYQQQYQHQEQYQHQQQYQYQHQQYHQPHPQQYQHPPPALYQQYQQVAYPPGTVHSMLPHQPW